MARTVITLHITLLALKVEIFIFLSQSVPFSSDRHTEGLYTSGSLLCCPATEATTQNYAEHFSGQDIYHFRIWAKLWRFIISFPANARDFNGIY
jgi:hypothetical protein